MLPTSHFNVILTTHKFFNYYEFFCGNVRKTSLNITKNLRRADKHKTNNVENSDNKKS